MSAAQRSVRGAVRRLWRRWTAPILPAAGLIPVVRQYARYFASWRRYRALPSAERLRLRDSYPCVFDATPSTGFDPHYFHQAVWAMKRIARGGARFHVDVGSEIGFVAALTTHLPVVFLDIRPLAARVARLHRVAASVLELPLADESAPSLSCLHVAEHIGLGRYGDPLNPDGTRQACAELARTLAEGGDLYLSLPIGRPRVCFNAHRVHAPSRILEYFHGLELVEFSAVDDTGQLREGASPQEMEHSDYACGLFHFRRPRSGPGGDGP